MTKKQKENQQKRIKHQFTARTKQWLVWKIHCSWLFFRMSLASFRKLDKASITLGSLLCIKTLNGLHLRLKLYHIEYFSMSFIYGDLTASRMDFTNSTQPTIMFCFLCLFWFNSVHSEVWKQLFIYLLGKRDTPCPLKLMYPPVQWVKAHAQ